MGAAIPVGVAVVPMGDIPSGLLKHLISELERRFAECMIYPPILIPPDSYDPRRRQYLSRCFLRDLRRVRSPRGVKLLGVTDVDLYDPPLNFVFGQAVPGGRCAVISLARLREEFYGNPPDEKLLDERMLKEAMHELGHTLGLGHCSNPRCVMRFSNSLKDTDFKSADMCDRCLKTVFSSMRVRNWP